MSVARRCRQYKMYDTKSAVVSPKSANIYKKYDKTFVYYRVSGKQKQTS
jgi:hypothetical protein